MTPWNTASFIPDYKWCPQAALRLGDWKLLTGCPEDSRWISVPNSSFNLSEENDFKTDTKKLFLFNIAEDPDERHELSFQHAEKVRELLARLEKYNNTAVPVRCPDPDPASDPKQHAGV